MVRKVVKHAEAVQPAESSTSVRVLPPPIFTMLSDAAKRGKEVESVHDGLLHSALVGIPFPSFACEIMFHESVFPLGRLICLDGMEETLKSGFLFDMVRWFLDASGSGLIVDTEGKPTQDWGPSIIGHERFGFFTYSVAEGFEEAQTLIQNEIKLARATFVKHGKFAPLLLGLDSATGVLTGSERNKIHKAGFASVGYSSVANATAKWLPSLIMDFTDMPMSMVVIRHERECDVVINGRSTGYKIPEPKGATEWSFHAYKTFHLQKDKNSEIDLARYGGRNILVYPKKGMCKGLKIPVRVLWWEEKSRDQETGKEIQIQRTKFCWERSTFMMLTNMDAQGIPKRYQSRVHDVLGPLNAKLDRVICKPLGLTVAATCEELSQALYHPSNIGILTELRRALGIKEGYVFRGDGTVLYDDAKETQRQKLIAERELINSGKAVPVTQGAGLSSVQAGDEEYAEPPETADEDLEQEDEYDGI